VSQWVQNVAAAMRRDERGADLIEWGLLVGLIAVVALVAVAAFGGNLNIFFTSIADTLN